LPRQQFLVLEKGRKRTTRPEGKLLGQRKHKKNQKKKRCRQEETPQPNGEQFGRQKPERATKRRGDLSQVFQRKTNGLVQKVGRGRLRVTMGGKQTEKGRTAGGGKRTKRMPHLRVSRETPKGDSRDGKPLYAQKQSRLNRKVNQKKKNQGKDLFLSPNGLGTETPARGRLGRGKEQVTGNRQVPGNAGGPFSP